MLLFLQKGHIMPRNLSDKQFEDLLFAIISEANRRDVSDIPQVPVRTKPLSVEEIHEILHTDRYLNALSPEERALLTGS